MRHNAEYVYALPFRRDEAFRVCQTYGGARSHTGRSFYSLDFWMPIGSTICAARDGRVVTVVEDNRRPRDDSNSIRVQHDDLSVAWYSHIRMNGALVELGDHVNAGQSIAISGNTGCSGRPHLHFHVVAGPDRSRVPTRFATSDGVCDKLHLDVFYQHPNLQATPRRPETDNHAIHTERRWFGFLDGWFSPAAR